MQNAEPEARRSIPAGGAGANRQRRLRGLGGSDDGAELVSW